MVLMVARHHSLLQTLKVMMLAHEPILVELIRLLARLDHLVANVADKAAQVVQLVLCVVLPSAVGLTGHDELRAAGALKSKPTEEVVAAVEEAVSEKALFVKFHATIVTLNALHVPLHVEHVH
jgi:hypothetical protein